MLQLNRHLNSIRAVDFPGTVEFADAKMAGLCVANDFVLYRRLNGEV